MGQQNVPHNQGETILDPSGTAAQLKAGLCLLMAVPFSNCLPTCDQELLKVRLGWAEPSSGSSGSHWVGSPQGPPPLGLWSQDASLWLLYDSRSHRVGRGPQEESRAQLLGKVALVLSWGLEVVGIWAR